MVRTTGNRDLLVTQDQLDQMLIRAGEMGAAAALKKIGLEDEHAVRDLRELRSLVDSYRFARRTIFETLLRWGTIAILGIMVLGVSFHYGTAK